jgi:hypothetical protein
VNLVGKGGVGVGLQMRDNGADERRMRSSCWWLAELAMIWMTA